MHTQPITASLYRKKNRSGTTSFVVRYGKTPKGTYRVKIFSPSQEQQARGFLEEWNRRRATETGSLSLLEEVHQQEIRLALQKLEGTGTGVLQAVEFYLKNTRIKHTNIPFSIGAEAFLKSLNERKRSPEYISSIKSTTIKPFQEHIQNVNISEITEEHVRSFILTNKSWSPFTQHSHRRNLSTLFNHLISEGYLISNPCRGIILPRQIKTKVNFWKPHEVYLQLQYSLEAKEYPTLAAMVLAAFVGPRLREASKIKWEQVKNLAEVEILPAQAKTFRRRLVNVSRTAAFWLSLIPKSKKRPDSQLCSLSSITTTIKRIKRTLENQGLLERRIQNGFRQAFAAHHYAKFKDERLLSEIMGNSIQVVKESYNGLTTESQANFYFNILPRESYIEGLKKSFELKLWEKPLKLHPNWRYIYSGEEIGIIDIKKHREYMVKMETEPEFNDNGNTLSADFNVQAPSDVVEHLKTRHLFMSRYGFDPENEEEVYLIHETKKHIEYEIGESLEKIAPSNIISR